jgi:succinyl-diaminopimelate desuccinylase
VTRLDDALELVSISSVSRNESEIAEHIEGRLRVASHLEVERIGDNVVARTTGHHTTRLIVAGHIDTVPGDASEALIVGEELRGVGACDMKGSVSVMIELALDATPRSVEITWIFYAREEIARRDSGLSEIAELRPELLRGDVAVLGEPTGGIVEAGCQGTLRIVVKVVGRRAHSARPFAGRNAIHRAGDIICRVAAYEPRIAEIDGITFTEQLQVVSIDGGVAPNVVPDLATLTLNHRFAPDRSHNEAVSWLRDYLGDLVEDEDTFEVGDWSPSALPSLLNERLRALVALSERAAVGKVGWTDVATFQELSIPATNFGAGDPLLAHRSDEFVTQGELDEFARVLSKWIA